MSDETRWTRGPWVRGKYGSIEDANGEIVEATGLALVTGYRDESDPAFANAHLIAAAPELYDALEELVEAFEHSGCGPSASDIDAAIAALAKARGEP